MSLWLTPITVTGCFHIAVDQTLLLEPNLDCVARHRRPHELAADRGAGAKARDATIAVMHHHANPSYSAWNSSVSLWRASRWIIGSDNSCDSLIFTLALR